MIPNSILDMPDVLVTFCSVAVGFALVGLGALVALLIEDKVRRRRTS
jgi:hypothetical protein